MEDKLKKLNEMLEVQGRSGTWNYEPYMHGMYNGMEFALSIMEDRDPSFREAPKKWLKDIKIKAKPILEPETMVRIINFKDWIVEEKNYDEDYLDSLKPSELIDLMSEYLAP